MHAADTTIGNLGQATELGVETVGHYQRPRLLAVPHSALQLYAIRYRGNWPGYPISPRSWPLSLAPVVAHRVDEGGAAASARGSAIADRMPANRRRGEPRAGCVDPP
jgi:hypothetical protein